jgi:serine/threonine protein kinase
MSSAASSADQPSPRPRFREIALASGLVTESQLAAAEAVVAGSVPGAEPPAAGTNLDAASVGSGSVRPAPPDPASRDAMVAEQLVRSGVLTAFQARELLAGKTRFRLGRYLVIDELGRGGMGQVFKAEHELMGRHVAIKVLPRVKSTPESEAAFRREMRILGRLDHENLVRAFDAGHDAMVYYLVTELVPGIDLRRQIRKYGPLDEVTAASVFQQVARGLTYAHAQGVVHRDVKPGNILVMDDGRVKVLDMGLAGSTLEADAIRLGRVVGTMDYIAPEQIRTPDDVGPAADLYALGCTLYFTLAGRVPFPGGSHQEKMQRHLHDAPRPLASLAPQASPAMCRLVEDLMQKSPAGRPASALELADRLAGWAIVGKPVPPPRGNGGEAVRGDWAADQSGSDRGRSSGSESAPRDATSQGKASLFETLLRDVQEACDMPMTQASLRTVARVVGVALAAGIGFSVVVALVQGIDPERFRDLPLIGSLRPAAFGWAGFLFMVAVQTFAVWADRRPG